MYVIALLLTTLLGGSTLAQVQPSSPPQSASAAVPITADTLNNGPCMDSPRGVPQALQPPAVRSQQVVQIDKVISTSSNLDGQVIGFLYTLQDGSTWLGQRTNDYISPAAASAINQVLASTHMPDQPLQGFPPATRLGVATKFQQYFKVVIPAGSTDGLMIRLTSCVAWPQTRPLPDPKV
jgi:hypothetical protein